MELMKRYRAGFLLILASGVAYSAFAHHSGSMWDSSKTVVLEGTVREFQWTNPHCWIQLLVPMPGDANAAAQEWSIEMGSPIQALQGGWKPGTLKPGDHIRVTLHPARDNSPAGNFISAVGADGHPLGRVQQDQS
jgi:hypothetical protein